MYIFEHSHFILFMKVSKEKLLMLRMIEFSFFVMNFYYCYQVYNNRRRYRLRPAMTEGQLMANIRR